MVDAFKTYSRSKHFHGRNSSYLLYLIDAFANICEFDNGIEPVLGTGLTKALLKFLKSSLRSVYLKTSSNYLKGLCKCSRTLPLVTKAKQSALTLMPSN
jgi:hypothetical protein